MQQRIRFTIFWIHIFFSFCITNFSHGQDFATTLHLADQKFAEGNYDLALKYYSRLAFFSESLYPEFFIKVAEIGSMQGDYDLAQKNYGFAINQLENDSLRTELSFKRAYCMMLDGNYQYAIIKLLSIDDSDESTKRRIDFYLGTCYFGMEDFDKAKEYFKACIRPEFHSELEKLFSKKQLFSPNPKTATVLSQIIPGTGQFYAGSFRDGANSLVLSAALIGLFVNSAKSYNYIYASFTVFPWFQRYYTGGFTRAEIVARIKRQKKRSQVYNQVLTLFVD